MKMKMFILVCHKNMFVVKTENTLLKVGLVDADYPDYKKVIPAEKGISVTLERESFCMP